MQPDDEVCLCYHVTLRKLLHFARRERPWPASRMSECLGAGTGCGWCIPFLARIAADPDLENPLPAGLGSEGYAAARESYRTSGRKNEFDRADGAAPR